MEILLPEYSDYVVYVDESGDHSLTTIDSRYPIFALSFCIFYKDIYTDIVTPALRRLKFSFFGHDMVILHEHEIRKKEGFFRLLSKEPRELFLNTFTDLMDRMDFVIVAVVIDKSKLGDTSSFSVYHLAMKIGLERVFQFLESQDQSTLLTHVICEARGKPEDQALEKEFRRICDGLNSFERTLPFQIIIADKKTNSEGLQLADMTARPIGLAVLRPDQPNRALSVISKKFYQGPKGEIEGHGFQLYPVEIKRSQGFPWSLTSVR
ncbi:MAG: DUF3800 domain-containing protein [Rhabdochlamydiaceae bacterium]|jgi:hypothetical protein